MIYTFEHLQQDTNLKADVCVIGTGAGGSPVAAEAAAAGLRVVALEAGSYLQPRDMSQLEHDMFQRLYIDGAGRTTEDRTIRVLQGKGVGGSTLHNVNLCKRLPKPILDDWAGTSGLSDLMHNRLPSLYDQVEKRLSVSQLTEAEVNPNNRALQRGCTALGYRGGLLSHNRVGCAGSGFCELGCPFDAKQNAMKVFMTEAVEDGAVVLADTWAERIEHDSQQARTVHAVVRHPQTQEPISHVRIDARCVCVSAGATHTPALLQRSAVPDPYILIGSRLFLHPGAAVAGVFPEVFNSWRGIPQSYECTEFLDPTPGSGKRVWIIPSFAHPAGASAALAAIGNQHLELMRSYPNLGVLTPMLHDESCGRVRPRGRFGVAIDYVLGSSDLDQLKLGLRECARLLLAAGASRAIVPLAKPLFIDDVNQVDRVFDGLTLRPFELELTATHPMGSVWLGGIPARSCVDPSGRYHHLKNLFVSDTSLFPTSTGAPPQLTTYAFGLHVAQAVRSFLT